MVQRVTRRTLVRLTPGGLKKVNDLFKNLFGESYIQLQASILEVTKEKAPDEDTLKRFFQVSPDGRKSVGRENFEKIIQGLWGDSDEDNIPAWNELATVDNRKEEPSSTVAVEAEKQIQSENIPTETTTSDAEKLIPNSSVSPQAAAITPENVAAQYPVKSLPKPPSGLVMWGPQFQPPALVQRGRYLTGQPPTPRHLHEGCFFPRQTVYEKLLQEVAESISSSTTTDETILWWLAGDSGCGKSVALLHILSMLYGMGYKRILWLLKGTQALKAAVEYAVELEKIDQTADKPVLIAMDDPYRPGLQEESVTHWFNAMENIQEGYLTSSLQHIPFLLCCGPTHYRTLFNQNKPQELQLKSSYLTRRTVDEHPALREWFHQRSGQPAPPPRERDETLLMVQLLFEWSLGSGVSLDAFAKRFREQLQESGEYLSKHSGYDPTAIDELRQLVDEIFALNRLYVSYPWQAMRERFAHMGPQDNGARAEDTFFNLMKAFSRSMEEDGEDIEAVKSDYLVTNAHLANTLYEIWYPEAACQTIREQHLIKVVEVCLQYGTNGEQFGPLWELSRRLQESFTGEGRVSPQVAQQLLEKIYTSDASGILIRLFVDLQKRGIELQLPTNPVETGLTKLKAISTKEAIRTRLCHHLLMIFPTVDEEQRVPIALGILETLEIYNTPHNHWEDWWRFWVKLRKLTTPQQGQPAILDTRPYKDDLPLFNKRIITEGKKWLRQTSHHRQWQQVWGGLPKKPDRYTKSIVMLGLGWLKDNQRHHSWRFIWESVLEMAETALQVSDIFRDGEVDNDGEVLGPLRTIDQHNILYLGEIWIQSHWWFQPYKKTSFILVPRYSHWGDAWKILYEKNWHRDFLFKFVLKKLKGTSNSSPWKSIWKPVSESRWNQKPTCPELHKVTMKWLKRRESQEKSEWIEVCKLMADHYSPNALVEQKLDLETLLMEWLSTRSPEAYGSWSTVWECGWRLRQGMKSQWLSKGMKCLQEATSNYRALWKVWCPLWQTSETNLQDRIELLSTGLLLLNICTKFDTKGKPSKTWLMIWTDLWDANHERLTLKGFGLNWLQEAMQEDTVEEEQWENVYSRLQIICRPAELENFRCPSTESTEVEQAA
ncbi:MAG: hypothetical protein AAGF93_01460 [Cyanobacteria bacterium P01_H01_bin.105]